MVSQNILTGEIFANFTNFVPFRKSLYVTHMENSEKEIEFRFISFEICAEILSKVLWGQKFAKCLSFAWMSFCNLPLRKNSARQAFVNTKILFLSILPINYGSQHEYLTSRITLSGKKSIILFVKIPWI